MHKMILPNTDCTQSRSVVRKIHAFVKMENLESTLIRINQFINIDRNRAAYTAHFVHLRKALFDKLEEDDMFKYLFNGFLLGGSYGDNLKVGLPDEFDQVFFLNLPEARHVIIKNDPRIPGNVFLNLTKILAIIERQKQHRRTYKYLKQWVNNDSYLIVKQLQSWLESCFTKVILFMRHEIEYNGSLSKLCYRKCGPAHTIFVTGPYKYSVDFVPAIKLNDAPVAHGQWEAIPKPMKPEQPLSTSFRSSFYLQEHRLIANNFALKNALRIMKKFRDTRQNMLNLKSYYIKTLFMWKAKGLPKDYWKKSLTVILIDMFGELENSLYREQLKFFWDPRLNMYDHLSRVQLCEMLKCVQGANRILMIASKEFNRSIQYKVISLFSTEEERRRVGISNPNTSTANLLLAPVDDKPSTGSSNRCVIN